MNKKMNCCFGFIHNGVEIHHQNCINYKKINEVFIDRDFLRNNKDFIFVFGDNDLRWGKGGAAILRDEPNTYGFITKKEPYHEDYAYYKPDDEYKEVFINEMKKIKREISLNPNKTFLISKLGAGIANKYHIYENIIEEHIKSLNQFNNVIFLF